MYLTHNWGKSVIAKSFFQTSNNKIHKYLSSVPKNVYIYKLEDIVTEYNNPYHSTIKIKPVYVKLNTNINARKEINNEDPKLIGHFVRM